MFEQAYVTAPALFRMLGMDWRDHFVARHCLARDWLRPMLGEFSARDMAVMGAVGALCASRLETCHEVSVGELLASGKLSDRAAAWLRATALGGIAGTLRMTVWELCQRVFVSPDALLLRSPEPLYWYARPANLPGGFVHVWVGALRAAGGQLHVAARVTAVHPSLSGAPGATGGGLDFEPCDGTGPQRA